jgi:hypothetical protein
MVCSQWQSQRPSKQSERYEWWISTKASQVRVSCIRFFWMLSQQSYPLSHPVFTLSLGLFSLTIPSLSDVRKVWGTLIKSGYGMLKLSIRGNYNSCTCRSSENICSNSGGAKAKGKIGSKPDETLFGTKSGAFLSLTPLPWKLVYSFAGFFYNLTWFWTELRVLVLCFPQIMENSSVCNRFTKFLNGSAWNLLPLNYVSKYCKFCTDQKYIKW